MHKRIIAAAAAILCLSCACQATPQKAYVTSKTGEDAQTAPAAAAAENEDAPPAESSARVWSDTVTSAGGDVVFTVSLEPAATPEELPVLHAAPQLFTAAEGERIAQALLPGADFYENTSQMSKLEIEQEILRLKALLGDREALEAYYDGNEEAIVYVTQMYEQQIETYEQLYPDAPDAVQDTPCDWTFHPTSYYDGTAEEDGWDNIRAKAVSDGIRYEYNVYVRTGDYLKSIIHAYADDIAQSDEELYSSQPLEEDDCMARAHSILDSLGFGEWEVASLEIRQSEQGLYTAEAYARPVFHGLPLLNAELLGADPEDAYAVNYEGASIRIKMNDRCWTAFEFSAPLDVEPDGETADLLPFDTVFEKLCAYLRLLDAKGFSAEEHAEVTVDRVELGYSRIRVKDNSSEFYLVPSYTFSWTPAGMTSASPAIPLVTINAVDGTIIDMDLGY